MESECRASKHLTPHRQHLHNHRSVAPNSAVTFVNGHQAAAVGQGKEAEAPGDAKGEAGIADQFIAYINKETHLMTPPCAWLPNQGRRLSYCGTWSSMRQVSSASWPYV
ncbi:hypothetical protein WJX82_008940 [Trebouxia sp. C0006]